MPSYTSNGITISQEAMSAYIAHVTDPVQHSEVIAQAVKRMETLPYDTANDASGQGSCDIDPNECC